MEDVLNRLRINCKHVTKHEWTVLEQAYKKGAWFTPNEHQWKAVSGLLALVDIRRGFKVRNAGTEDESVQFGVAQIRINEHGKKAIEERRAGRVYVYGDPVTQGDLENIKTDWVF